MVLFFAAPGQAYRRVSSNGAVLLDDQAVITKADAVAFATESGISAENSSDREELELHEGMDGDDGRKQNFPGHFKIKRPDGMDGDDGRKQDVAGHFKIKGPQGEVG